MWRARPADYYCLCSITLHHGLPPSTGKVVFLHSNPTQRGLWPQLTRSIRKSCGLDDACVQIPKLAEIRFSMQDGSRTNQSLHLGLRLLSLEEHWTVFEWLYITAIPTCLQRLWKFTKSMHVKKVSDWPGMEIGKATHNSCWSCNIDTNSVQAGTFYSLSVFHWFHKIIAVTHMLFTKFTEIYEIYAV